MRLVATIAAATLGLACTSSQTGSTTTVPTAGSTAGGAAPAPYKSGPPQKVVSVEGITEYTLDNGLRVLLFPDPSQATVTVNITYFVGSRHEGYGEAGMAHLLEHLVFKGTPTHPDVWKLLEDHGASFNGTTWVDRTNYYETMPASDENLAFGIALEADRMINSNISADDLKTEFSVVRNEFELGENSPRGVLMERMHSMAYLWHNYGNSTIGNKSDIERVEIESLRAFYKKYYQPNNAMLVVAGRFEESRALELIHEHFGSIPKPAHELPKTYTVEPVQDGERTVTLRRVGDVAVVGLLYHVPAGAHSDFSAAEALAHVLTDEPSGRLYKALVETGMATNVYGFAFSWADPGTLQLYAEVRAGKPIAPVRDKMIEIVESLGVARGEAAISDADVSRFKNRSAKQFDLAIADSGRAAIELTEYAAMGDWRLMFVMRDRVAALDTARVRRVAGEYLVRSNRTVGTFVPTEKPKRAPQPEAPDVASMVEDYRGNQELAAGEKFEATVANVEARTSRHKLASGLQIAMLPKETRGDAVRLAMTLRYGTERDLQGKLTTFSLIPDMLMRGTKSRSYQQIRDELDRLKAQVRFTGAGPGATRVTVTTKREHLVDAIGLIAEMLQQPSFPKDQFDIVVKEKLAQLEERRSEPTARASNALQRAMSPWPKGDVRYVPTLDERLAELKRVRLADVKALHGRFWGASHAQVAVVGDFDPDQVRGAIERKFGSWRSPRPFVRVGEPYRANKSGSQVIETPDKKMAIVIAAHNIQMKDDHADYPALAMAGYILGGNASSRLLNRLRQKEGLSYGAFGGVQIDALDDAGRMFGAGICAPENAGKAMKYLLEEIDLLVAKGVGEKELADAKASYALQFESRLADDDFLVGQLSQGLFIDRTLVYRQQLLDKIEKLTPEDVKRAIVTYIKPGMLYKVSAGDLAGKVSK